MKLNTAISTLLKNYRKKRETKHQKKIQANNKIESLLTINEHIQKITDSISQINKINDKKTYLTYKNNLDLILNSLINKSINHRNHCEDILETTDKQILFIKRDNLKNHKENFDTLIKYLKYLKEGFKAFLIPPPEEPKEPKNKNSTEMLTIKNKRIEYEQKKIQYNERKEKLNQLKKDLENFQKIIIIDTIKKIKRF